MTDIDLSRGRLEAIKAGAAQATKGPWELEHDPDGQTIRVNAGSARTHWVTDEHGDRWPQIPAFYCSTDRVIDFDDTDYESGSIDEQQLLANARHIANTDPEFVTALIDRCLALEAAVDRAIDLSERIDRSPTQPQEWIDSETGVIRDIPESIREVLGSSRL